MRGWLRTHRYRIPARPPQPVFRKINLSLWLSQSWAKEVVGLPEVPRIECLDQYKTKIESTK